jgi:hypothetical protein
VSLFWWLLAFAAAGAVVWGLFIAGAALLAGIVNAVEWAWRRIVH